jgi:hypothetical protein
MPDTVEHPAIRTLEKPIPRHDVPAAERPAIGRCDILLFKLVKLAAHRDVGRDEIVALGGRQRRWAGSAGAQRIAGARPWLTGPAPRLRHGL